jgi:hypothetical protein
MDGKRNVVVVVDMQSKYNMVETGQEVQMN